MSGSAIADGLITMLSAASAFGSDAVAKDFSVLERSSGSCCVVSWRRFVSVPAAFGDPTAKDRQWTHTIMGFVKDLGDAKSTLGRVMKFGDVVLGVIEANDSLQGTVNSVDRVEGGRDLNAAVRVGGANWIPIFIDVVSTELV